MTQLNLNAPLLIEDRLDAIGQRWRVLQLLRGMLLFLAGVIIASLALGLAAHLVGLLTAGQSIWIWVIAATWCAWLAVSFIAWIVRPMILRPRVLETARLVESRVDGLHNTLTNSILLHRAGDLNTNPYVPVILDENYRNASQRNLDAAVQFGELRRLSMFVAILVLVLGGLLIVPAVRARIGHGWKQMMAPTAFVPIEGETQILEIQPGNVKLIAGQPLEVTVISKHPDPKAMPGGKLIFAMADDMGRSSRTAELIATASGDGRLRYNHRVEHVDKPMRYRVEIGSSQSAWFEVQIIKDVKLQELSLTITPPLYTRKPERKLTFKAEEEITKEVITAPQGSRVEITAQVDVPVRAGMLQVGDGAPVTMASSELGRRFTGSMTLMDDAPLSVLMTEGAGQIIAQLPKTQQLVIRCTKDQPPTIEMRWPQQDTAVDPNAEIRIQAMLKDDYGVSNAKVLLSAAPDQPLAPMEELAYADPTSPRELGVVLKLKPELRKHGNAIRIQVETTDNRDLKAIFKSLGRDAKGTGNDDGSPQTTSSTIYEIKFRDPEQIKKEEKEKFDKLREALMEMLKAQQALHATTVAWKPADLGTMAKINSGQVDLRTRMKLVVDTFPFDADTRMVQKTLGVLYVNQAKEAVDVSAAIPSEPLEKQRAKQSDELQARQRRIISTLESLLALLAKGPDALLTTSKKGGDMPMQKEAMEKLNEDLKKFLKEEQRILDQTAQLAKKPVDNFDDKDKKLLEDLLMAQEKLDAFMQEKVNDVSKLAEQDMANASLLKEMLEVYSEVTMAKNALKDKATEIAVAAEEMGQEMAKEIESNLEKWLMDKPDRQEWKQEDATTKSDIPMAELPKELEDMVGELMEQQEDLFEEMEDMDANWADSLDKGAGWDAADGPIANMSAKGVTGNQLPNNNNMNGRSGEGRSGKSQGEFVEDTATGKGGRNTPTRLDPTPFQQGQVKDESKDPVGGATGGGKISGQGGAGLEGPVPPKMKEEMKRLAEKQAQIRNNAERLNLQYQLGRYDNFKLLESIALMRRVESDLKANRYQMAMRRKDMLLDAVDTSHALVSGKMHVQQDTTPKMNTKLQEQINDAMKGELPPAWSEALKEYYKKLSQE